MREKSVNYKELEGAWKTKFSPKLKAMVHGFDFRYLDLTPKENKYWLSFADGVLGDQTVRKAGEHRLDEWETGWSENLKMLLLGGGTDSLRPLYYGKYDVLRWLQKFIKPVDKNFEYNFHVVMQNWLFGKYLKDVDSIYEFGCGTGHNLLRAGEINPRAKLYGLDWAESSQRILSELTKRKFADLIGRRFDFFNPDRDLVLDKNSGVYTFGALEQVGQRFRNFVDYILKNKPRICVNAEILWELMDPENPLDSISINYTKKRNYLDGFLTYLRDLEKGGKIVIHDVRRLGIGNLFIENPSVVIWSPK